MIQKFLCLFLIMLLNNTLAKAETLFGNIINQTTKLPIKDAEITLQNISTNTDEIGSYQIVIAGGTYKMQIVANGYKTLQQTIFVKSTGSGMQLMNFEMQPTKKEISAITVSGSRFKKRAAEEIVSIEILQPSFIKNAAINRVDEALNKMPGVTVIDNQINIRGGAGWSYGAGSRVMVMVDDMPMLSADAQDAKWDFLPIENCEQIEVMKGAASTLYGSSALNGVVNFRTAYAKSKPITKIQLYNGLFDNPNRKELIWWGKKQPSFMGGYASHSRKLGNTDLVFGSAWFSEDSYLQGDATRRIRFNANIRHRNKKIAGLQYGFNTNMQIGKTSTFFLHEADTSLQNLLKPFGGLADSSTTLNKNSGTRANIDPYISYYGKKGWQHYLRTRYLFIQNLIPEKLQTSTGNTVYAEYQFVKKWNDSVGLLKNLNMIGGAVAIHNNVKGELYGNHKGYNLAQYIQLEKKIGKVWLVAGARQETNAVDTYKVESRFVFRSGLNYEPTRGTNMRVSWGQGYRYPTIAERFVQTNFGASSVFPNPSLKSEQGWSTELGVKQGFAIGKWIGFADVAVFEMRYQDMMEFNFGINLPDTPITSILPYLGFKSKNIGNTKINGIDVSVFAQYSGNKINHQLMLGYNYINPTQSNLDSASRANYSTDKNVLKYRNLHNMKATWDLQYKNWSIATINTITSPMINIDAVFENSKPDQNFFGRAFEVGTSPNEKEGDGLASTVRKHRQIYNKWIWIGDIRVSYQLSATVRIGFVTKNIANTEYYVRPALIGALRNYTLQLFVDL
jgi:outer membrane receptor protein involved in Fe transport